MASINRSLKRKACSSYIPGSIFSFVMGALRDNFILLKNHIVYDCPFVASKENPGLYAKQLLEELFRYLYLLADSSSDGVVRSSPSYFVDQAFHYLLLDPVLYWKVCDEILNMQGKTADELKVRLLPHDVLSGVGDDEKPRKVRYYDTLDQYKEVFGEDPPLAIWSDYSNDPVAMQAVLEAQEAQSVAVHPSHLRLSTPIAVTPQVVCICHQRIDLIVREHSGEVTPFQTTKGTPMKKVMEAFAEQKGKHVDDFRFTLEGTRILYDDTPLSLDLRDNDQIEVCIQLKGC